MKDYIVTLSETDEPVSDRKSLVEVNEARTRRLIEEIKHLLVAERLEEDVDMIGEPLALPFLEIVCTPRVASLVRTLPEVESVAEDNVSMSLI